MLFIFILLIAIVQLRRFSSFFFLSEPSARRNTRSRMSSPSLHFQASQKTHPHTGRSSTQKANSNREIKRYAYDRRERRYLGHTSKHSVYFGVLAQGASVVPRDVCKQINNLIHHYQLLKRRKSSCPYMPFTKATFF